MRIIQKKLKAFICCVYLPADDATFPHGHRQDRRKMLIIWVSMYLTLKYCAHYCYISSYRWGCHFTRSSEPCESLAVYRVKAVTKLLSYVIKTLSVLVQPWVSDPQHPSLQSTALLTEPILLSPFPVEPKCTRDA